MAAKIVWCPTLIHVKMQAILSTTAFILNNSIIDV